MLDVTLFSPFRRKTASWMAPTGLMLYINSTLSIFSPRFAVCAGGCHFMYGVSYIYNIYMYIYTVHTILAQHIRLSAGRLFRNIHQSLHYSSVLLTHSRVLFFLFFFFSVFHPFFLPFFHHFFFFFFFFTHGHSALTMPPLPGLVTVCTIFVSEALSQSASQFQSLS